MNLIGDPAAIDILANTLASRAGQVASVGRRVEARADSCRWECHKADRFRQEMRSRHSQAEHLAAELTDLSHQLHRLAAEVRAELNFLHSIERKIRQFFDDYVPMPNVDPPWIGTPWHPGNLPGSGDPIWRTLGHSFGI